MKMNRSTYALLLIGIILSGCAALLPTGKDIARSRWKSFDNAKTDFDKVVPSKTTTGQLKALGFDLYSTPNVRILNYIDIAVATQSLKKEELDGGLALCLSAKNNCQAYEFISQEIRSERYGNFWLDFFNFKRRTMDKGWRFKALFVVVDNIVVEKLWSGDPNVYMDREAKNPLGILQEGGGMLFKVIP